MLRVHLVTKITFRKRVPLPPICGNHRAKTVTVDSTSVTCQHCLRRDRVKALVNK